MDIDVLHPQVSLNITKLLYSYVGPQRFISSLLFYCQRTSANTRTCNSSKTWTVTCCTQLTTSIR